MALASTFLMAQAAYARDLDPQLIGRWPGYDRGPAQSIALSGNYAFVAAGSLQVLDIADPTSPRRVGWYNGTSGGKLAVSGQFAYILDKDALQVVDVSDPARPRRVGGLAIGGGVLGLAVWSHYACMAQQTAQGLTALQIIDVSNPANPRRVGRFDSTGEAVAVAGLNQYAFVADGPSGLQVIDLQDPARPQRVGAYRSNGGYARGVAVSGNYVYLADTAAGLQVIDVADPSAPRPTGRCALGGPPYAVAVSGHYALLAIAAGVVQRTSIQVIDVSVPTDPQRIGGFDTSDVQGMAVSGAHLYVADGDAGLQVLDFSNPSAPQPVAHLQTGGQSDRVAVADHYAYVAESLWDGQRGRSQLRVIDVGQAANPQEVGGVETRTLVPDDRVEILQLALSGKVACLIERWPDRRFNRAFRAAAHLIDIANPVDPRRLAAIETGSEWAEVSFEGQFAYLAESRDENSRPYGRLEVFNLSEPGNPQRMVSLETTWLSGIAVSGHLAYLTGTDFKRRGSDFTVLDISEPSNPRKLSELHVDGWLGAVTLSGGYAYCRGEGLQVIDITDPKDPKKAAAFAKMEGAFSATGNVGCLRYGGSPYDMPRIEVVDLRNHAALQRVGTYLPGAPPAGLAIAPDRLYVAAGQAGVEIVNFGNVAAVPRLSSSFSGVPGQDVAVSGGYAYLLEDGLDERGEWRTRFAVIDVNDLAKPRGVGAAEIYEESRTKIAVSGTHAYVPELRSDGDKVRGRLAVLDVGNPVNPQRVSALDITGRVSIAALSGSYVCLLEHALWPEVAFTLDVIDIGDPGKPRKVGELERKGEWAAALAASETHAFLASERGLEVIDLSDPANPRRIGGCQVPGQIPYPNALAISGGYAYLAEGFDPARLEIIDVSDPTNPRWVSGHDAREADALTVSGHYAFVGGRWAGVEVIDVRDPANPRRVGANSAFGVSALATQGGNVYVGSPDAGLVILDSYQPPPRLTLLSGLNMAGFHFQLQADLGQAVRLQRTTDLRTWQDWRTIIGANSPQHLVDESARGLPMQFYRATAP